MHKESEKSWLAHLAEDQRYAAMAAAAAFPRGSLFCSSIRRNRRGCRRRRARPTAAVDVFNEADPVIFFLGS